MDRTTDRLAKFATSLRYADLPASAVQVTKKRVLDALGCGIGGYDSEPAEIARRLAAMSSSPRPARVLGSGQRTSVEAAAFANTSMVRYLDCNDTHFGKLGSGHPSDMIPGVLAVAEATGGSGQDVIAAIVVAYEIFGALAEVVSLRERGWDQGVFVVVGTAAAAGRILGLTEAQMGHAISLAVTPNVPTRQTRAGELSMWKGCATAASVRSGIFAAQLAREGMTGPFEPFEGHHGIHDQVSGPFELPPLDVARGPLTVERAHYKFFPAEYHSQAPLWMALEIRKKVKPENVESLDIQTYWMTYSEIGSEPAKWDPQTRETADHSLPYMLACALRDGTITPGTFALDKIRDPSLRPLMNKIKVRENKEFSRQYPERLVTEIEVTTVAGERFVERAAYPRGHEKNPMTDAEIEQKFRDLVAPMLKPPQVQRAIETIGRLESLPNASQVLDAFQT